ncbi:MAG: HD domain-containing protein [Bythopirellula sp.]|nr:HD domain-containing protein [Bythopirellula sp.]
MTKSSRLNDTLQQLREELQTRRAEIQASHERGLPGAQVSAKLASLLDTVLMRLFDATLAETSPAKADKLRANLVIVCLGSYGRRQCSPDSDVDLMFLYNNMRSEEVAEILRPLTQGVFDIGLQLGSSIRNPSDAVLLARGDAVICTSLIDSRLLLGNQTLFDDFRNSFEKMVRRNSKALCRTFLEARTQERDQYGESVYLLEPHVKRSRGGLRDINLLRWLGFAEFGAADPDRLHLLGAISKFDHHRLQSATEYLLRLRNEMHFHSGSSTDMLDRAEQLRIADWLGLQQRSGLLPVEQFMRDYFRHTNHVWQLVRRREASLIATSAVSRVLEPIFSRSVGADFRVTLNNVGVTTAGLAKIKQDMTAVLRLVELAAEENKPLDQQTYSALLLAAPDFPDEASDEVRRQFYDRLATPHTVGRLLSLLHELGYLEKLVPAMRHARCLLQFNQYHKYTVDEHTLLAVSEAAGFAKRDDALGYAYREIADKRILHFALLLHDLGKGFEEDHSDVGKRIAEETTKLFQLDDRSSDDIAFLVHKHLTMSHLTFRRDTSDIRLLEAFARQVGTVDRLRMLFAMTCADLAAVGPDVLTDWKRDVLAGVYSRTAGFQQDDDSTDFRAKLTAKTAAVLKQLTPAQQADDWYVRQLGALPSSHLISLEATEIVEILARLKALRENEPTAWCAFQKSSKTIVCSAGINHGVGRGVFSSMAGALSSEGLEILSADIDVLADELLLVRYTVNDPQTSKPPTKERLKELSQKMVAAIDSSKPPQFRRVWGQDQIEASRKLTPQFTEVRIDNDLSEDYTIVEVFTFDRPGLLYALARKLHDLGLVISHAKIGTYIDQVVDVFYVTARENGQKIHDEGYQNHIKHEMYHAAEAK